MCPSLLETQTAPAVPSATTTFSLEAPLPSPALGHPLRNLRRLHDARVQRFAFFGVGPVLATGSATALFYGANTTGWGTAFVVGLALLARALRLWMRRPFLRLSASGLTFRLTPTAEKHTVRWEELERLDTELCGVPVYPN